MDRVPSVGPRVIYATQAIRDKFIDRGNDIRRHGFDIPEVKNWR